MLRTLRSLRPWFVVFALSLEAVAQGRWTFRSSAANPPGASSAMAFSTSSDKAILAVGGFNIMETWTWDGTQWSQELPAGSIPIKGQGYSMTYDSSRNVAVLSGGDFQSSDMATWEYSGSTWTFVGRTGPTHRYEHATTFDRVRNTTILFGGLFGLPCCNRQLFNDTWEWDCDEKAQARRIKMTG